MNNKKKTTTTGRKSNMSADTIFSFSNAYIYVFTFSLNKKICKYMCICVYILYKPFQNLE